MVLGLYAGLPDYDYRHELDRIQGTGATCVSLQAIYRMETGTSNEIRRHPTSSPTDAALRRTFREARERQLRVMFFPTINLRDEAENEKWWRGNIEPSDWDLWWRNYTDFNVHLARHRPGGRRGVVQPGHRDGQHPPLPRPLARAGARRCAGCSRASSPTASTSTATTASPSATAWT